MIFVIGGPPKIWCFARAPPVSELVLSRGERVMGRQNRGFEAILPFLLLENLKDCLKIVSVQFGCRKTEKLGGDHVVLKCLNTLHVIL